MSTATGERAKAPATGAAIMTGARTPAVDWLVLAILAAAALAPAMRAGNADFTYPDAARHAMDGVFALDAARALPFDSPMEWAKEYYATSPALGFGRYPPLFAIVQAPFYALLGVCPFAGRLAVAVVWLAGLVFFYDGARRAQGRPAAALAACALAAGPASVRWGGEVMLELPATAFMLAAAYFYVRYIETTRARWLTAAIVMGCVAAWVKQPAALVVAVIGAHLVLVKRPRVTAREALPGLALGAVIAAPLGALAWRFGATDMALVTGAGRTYAAGTLEHWLVYLRSVPGYYLGWPAAVLAAGGALYGALRGGSRHASLWFLWAAAVYAFFTAVGYKSPRLAMLWTPALAFFAGEGLRMLTRKSGKAWTAAAATAAFAAIAVTYGWSWAQLPRAGGEVRAAAAKAISLLPSRIFYLGPANGTFVFRVRELAGPNPPAVVRGSKVLYADVIQRELGSVERVSTVAEVKEMIARVAPDVAVIERGAHSTRNLPAAAQMFLEYAATDAFGLLYRVAAPEEEVGGSGYALEVYTYDGPRSPEPVELPILSAGMTVELAPEGE